MRKGRRVVKREEGVGDVMVGAAELDEAAEAAMLFCLVVKDGGRHRLQVSCASAFASM